jgi:hypothetical protein
LHSNLDDLHSSFEFIKSSDNNTTLEKIGSYPAAYMPYFNNPDLLKLFFELTRILASDDGYSFKCRVLLQNLASVQLDTKDSRVKYLTTFVQGLISLDTFKSVQFLDIFRQLVVVFRFRTFLLLPECEMFFEQFFKLTILSLKSINNDMEQDSLFSDFDQALDAWSTVIVDVMKNMSSTNFSEFDQSRFAVFYAFAYQIYSEYIATRFRVLSFDYAEADEIQEEETQDRVLFSEQLSGTSYLGRLNVTQSIGILLNTIAECYQGVISGSSTNYVYDKMHWSLLLSTFLLSDVAESDEYIMIPDIFIKEENAVAALALIERIFSLKDVLLLKDQHSLPVLSPLVAETLLWSMSRIVAIYFYCDKADYPQFPNALQTLESATFVVSIFEVLVFQCMDLWKNETTVMIQLSKLLLSFSSKNEIAKIIRSTQSFMTFVNSVIRNLKTLPEIVQPTLVQILFNVATCVQGKDEVSSFVFESVQKFYLGLLNNPSFQKNYMESNMMNFLVQCFEVISYDELYLDFHRCC